MKIHLIQLLLFLFPATVLAQEAMFPETDYDAGDLSRDTVLVHVFPIKNTGQAPLELREAVSTCPCVHAEFSTRFLSPGQTGRVMVFFQTRGRRQGHFQQLVRVYTSASSRPVNLHLRGRIK